MKIVTGILSLGIIAASMVGAAKTSDGAPSAELVGDPAIGKATFTQYCSICHGVGAKGFIGPSIAGINWTVSGLHTIVRNGLGGYGGMPAFHADAVSDQNIADISAYLAALPSGASATSVAVPQATTAAVASPTPAPVSSSTATSATPGTPDLAHGRQIYAANCATCHGANAQGGVGPALIGEKNRKGTAAAIAWIKNPKLPMPKLYPDVLSEKDVEDVTAYIESL